jgi:hypothetical protein
MTRRTFRLDLIDAGAPDDAPVCVRLRRAMKALLRSYGLRCTRAVETTEEPVEAPDDAGEDAR